MGFKLNGQQKWAHDDMVDWWKRDTPGQLFEISGYAGTGKTTIIKYFIETLGLKKHEVIFTSFTGKAVQLLNMKGNYAKTIHSLFYQLSHVPVKDDLGNIIMINGRPKLKMAFVKVDEIPPGVRLIVIDEASMVGKKIGTDILSFGIPVITLGDLQQLPPVLDQTFFLKNPNVQLTEIMRQAADNPLIHISQQIVQDKKIELGEYGGKVLIVDKATVNPKMYTWADIILCSKNATRDNINNFIKGDLFKKDLSSVQRGDKIICRKNNWNLSVDDIYLINGLIGKVTRRHMETYNGKSIEIDFRPEFFDEGGFENITLDTKYFHMPYAERKEYKNFGGQINLFELAYAISVHLSQGSEYDKVLFMEERMGDRDFHKKLMYTAVTRSRDKLIWGKEMPKPRFYNIVS